MAYVVDASALVELLLASDEGAVRQLINAEDLLAPHILISEVMSSLRRLERAGVIAPELGDRTIARTARVPLRYVEDRLLMKEAWRMRRFLRTSDALYVAAAQASKSPLLTSDERLARAVRHQVPDVQVVSV
ncbi:MAG: type II toxin-antitoxin system VapC family toxin [Marmoricola sp.]